MKKQAWICQNLVPTRKKWGVVVGREGECQKMPKTKLANHAMQPEYKEVWNDAR